MLYLLGGAAVALTIASEWADKSVLGMLAAIMWMFLGGYALWNQSISLIYLYLGVASMLIGITYGIVCTVSMTNDSKKEREEIEAQIALDHPASFDDQLILTRKQRKLDYQKKQGIRAQETEQQSIRKADAAAKRYS